MDMSTELNNLLKLKKVVPNEPDINMLTTRMKTFFLQNGEMAIIEKDNFEGYLNILNNIYQIAAKKFGEKFSNKTLSDYIKQAVNEFIVSNSEVTKEYCSKFFEILENKKAKRITTYIPITGIKFKVPVESQTIGPFKIRSTMPTFTGKNMKNCYSLAIDWKNVYDLEKVSEKTELAALDFCKLIYFSLGTFNGRIMIGVGAKALNSMPVAESDSLYYMPSNGVVFYDSSTNEPIKKYKLVQDYEILEIDDELCYDHPDLKKIWLLYETQHDGGNLNDMEKNIVNAALLVGESVMSTDLKTATLYSCIALECLFGCKDRDLFVRSIGERLSESVALILGKNFEGKQEISKFVKEIYGARSAISHGGEKKLDKKYIQLNFYIRDMIALLLTHPKLSLMKNADDFTNFIKEKKFSINYIE